MISVRVVRPKRSPSRLETDKRPAGDKTTGASTGSVITERIIKWLYITENSEELLPREKHF